VPEPKWPEEHACDIEDVTTQRTRGMAETSAFAAAAGSAGASSSEMRLLISQLLTGTGQKDRGEKDPETNVANAEILTGSTDAEFEQMIPIIKNVFRSGKQAAFADELAAFAQSKQEEIERLCGYNYQVGIGRVSWSQGVFLTLHAAHDALQEFVTAVDHLLKVRQAAGDLKTRIIALNEDRQASGKVLLEKKRELLKQRKLLGDLESTIEGLQKCLEVLRISNKMYMQVEAKKYYSALRVSL
jgi:hypothetical protein